MASIVLGSNIASLQAQRRLNQSTSTLGRSFERLASGLRINRAGDDAAGLSISESLKADRRIANQGVRNFNDATSLLNIADSTLEGLSNIVIRLKELSEQAANGVYGNVQRKAMDTEAQKLAQEYERIAQTTQFNNLKLFDGSLGTLKFQGGVGLNGGITTGIGGAIGTGSFATAISNAVSPSVLKDMNNDGYVDLIGIDAGAASFSIQLSNGDGTFRAAQSVLFGVSISSIDAADFDGDGILDIVTGFSLVGVGNDVGVLFGNGNGTFTALASYSTGQANGISRLVTGDFNGDGKADISTIASSTEIGAFLAQGNRSFKSYAQVNPGFITLNGKSEDLNGDGRDDLVFTSFAGGNVRIYLANSDGTFRSIQNLPVDTNPQDSELGDLNGDGILDLVTSNANSDSISISFGRGNGTFTPFDEFLVGDSPRDLVLGDFDGDGILDIAEGDAFDNTLSVMIGNGNGTFRARTTAALTVNFSGLLQTGDLNGDGVLDITCGDSTNQQIFYGNTRQGVGPLLPFSLKSIAGARTAMSMFGNKLSQLNVQRGNIGALQSRLVSAVNALEVSSENIAVAASRITDVDIAEESAQLVKTKIIQNAATSILAQANAQPALALTLLGPKSNK